MLKSHHRDPNPPDRGILRRILVFSLLALLGIGFNSCEDDITDTDELVLREDLPTSERDLDIEQAAAEVANAYLTAFAQPEKTASILDGEGFTNSRTYKEVVAMLDAYQHASIITEDDRGATVAMISLFQDIVAAGDISTNAFGNRTSDILITHNCSLERTPMSYITISMFRNWSGIDASRKAQAGVTRKNNDNVRCAMVGPGCQQSEYRPLANQAAGITAGFTTRQLLDGSNLSSITQNAIAAVATAVVAFLVSEIGSGCDLECDDCFNPVGIAVSETGGCNIRALEAVGQFEFNEGFYWRFSPSRNGIFGQPDYTLTNRLSSSGFPSQTTPFEVIVAAVCDGNEILNWGPRRGVTVDPRDPLLNRPSATVNGPRLINGYYLLSGTNYCFNVSNVNLNEHTFIGWRAFGGTPSTAGPQSSFCTSYPNNTQPRFAAARYRNDCTGEIYEFMYSFLVCPDASCS